MTNTDGYPTLISTDVIHPIRDRLRHPRRKVMTIHLNRVTTGLILPARVGVLTNKFLLFTVDTDDRLPTRQELLRRSVDIPELPITIRVRRTLLRLEHRLQPVPGLPQQPRHRARTDR